MSEKIFMPYDIPISELSDRLVSIGFELSNYMNKGTENKLKNILLLSSENLECLKSESNILKASTNYQIIDITEMRDISDEIESDSVILSLAPHFDWGVGDDKEKYVQKRGQMYMEVNPISTDGPGGGTLSIMFFCVELSYRFGTKFKWYTERYAKSYIISTLDGSGVNESSFKLIEQHKSEIESNYSVRITVKKGKPYRKPFTDDFEV